MMHWVPEKRRLQPLLVAATDMVSTGAHNINKDNKTRLFYRYLTDKKRSYFSLFHRDQSIHFSSFQLVTFLKKLYLRMT